MAKYSGDTPPADPGIIRTVLVPVKRPTPIRTSRHRDSHSQLTLGLG